MTSHGLVNGGSQASGGPTPKLTREDLYSLEQYAQIRDQFRAKVMQHKMNRRVAIGPNATLCFEDRLTMHYQVQEMLRAERIFEPDGIEQEIEAYNSLIPDGGNWKATFLLEYPDVEERRLALERLRGIEDRVWAGVVDPSPGLLSAGAGSQHAGTGFEPVWAIADEDLDRENDVKTSSVHFLRFELGAPVIAAVKRGAAVRIGIDHPMYRHELALPAAVRDSLAADLVG